MKLIGEHFNLSDGTCLTQLPKGYTTPQIRVTLTEPETTRKPVGPTRGADLQKLIEMCTIPPHSKRAIIAN